MVTLQSRWHNTLYYVMLTMIMYALFCTLVSRLGDKGGALLRCVGVIWFILHVFQPLSIRLHNNTCVVGQSMVSEQERW